MNNGIQISFSAAERYILSPMSYFLHYLLKLRPVELSSPLIFGNAIDAGLNDLLKYKSLTSAKDKFQTELKNEYRIKGVVKFSKADLDESLIEGIDIPEDHDPAWYSLREKGIIMLEAYAEQVLPKIKQVHEIQHNISLTNENGDTFIGIVDLIATLDDGKRYLLDNKTTTKKYDSNAVETSSQLATYYEALKDEFKLDGVGYITISKTIRKRKLPKCEINIMLGSVGEELIDETFKKYDEVLSGIKTAKFECSGNCCKLPWPCAYKNYCASGGKDITGLKYQEKK